MEASKSSRTESLAESGRVEPPSSTPVKEKNIQRALPRVAVIAGQTRPATVDSSGQITTSPLKPDTGVSSRLASSIPRPQISPSGQSGEELSGPPSGNAVAEAKQGTRAATAKVSSFEVDTRKAKQWMAKLDESLKLYQAKLPEVMRDYEKAKKPWEEERSGYEPARAAFEETKAANERAVGDYAKKLKAYEGSLEALAKAKEEDKAAQSDPNRTIPDRNQAFERALEASKAVKAHYEEALAAYRMMRTTGDQFKEAKEKFEPLDRVKNEFDAAARAVKNVQDRINKLQLMKAKIAAGTDGDLVTTIKETKSKDVKTQVRDARNAVRASMDEFVPQLEYFSKRIQSLTKGIDRGESGKAFLKKVAALVERATVVIDKVKADLHDTDALVLLESFDYKPTTTSRTVEEGASGKLEKSNYGVSSGSLARPLVGELAGITALGQPDLCEEFHKTFLIGGLLKGIYGEGLPKFPPLGAGFNPEKDRPNILAYFSKPGVKPKVAEECTQAYIDLCSAYGGRGSNPNSYLTAAQRFTESFHDFKKQAKKA